jgi:hypothetical protein
VEASGEGVSGRAHPALQPAAALRSSSLEKKAGKKGRVAFFSKE